jgi:hypothetical protein
MPRRRVWWLCLRFMSPGFMCLVFMSLGIMCPGRVLLRKFGATSTTVGSVAKSAGSCARRSGSAVVGVGSVISAISGSGTELLRSAGFDRVFLFVER